MEVFTKIRMKSLFHGSRRHVRSAKGETIEDRDSACVRLCAAAVVVDLDPITLTVN